jgi:hypothetical protein
MTNSFEDMKPATAFHMESVSANSDGTNYAEDSLTERGALLLEEERHLSIWQSAKIHWRSLLICASSFILENLSITLANKAFLFR